MTGIIILNWNGWKDTIMCLASLYQIDTKDFVVVVVDNGSADNSVNEINNWLQINHITSDTVEENGQFSSNLINKMCIVYQLKQNYGFAKGNNLGISLIEKWNLNNYLCLNNDTEVTSDFLDKLIDFQKNNNTYSILTPQIRYYEPKNLIWNCGGAFFFGFRKYKYNGQDFSKIKEKEFIPIGYCTGCAMFFPADLLENGKIFTESFFFGEEDFELAFRMKKKKVKMACIISSLIYHKVGTSTKNVPKIGKIYIHYLNRFINVRQHFSAFQFCIWKWIYTPYIFLLLSKYFSYKQTYVLLKKILSESKTLNQVTQETFNKYLYISKI